MLDRCSLGINSNSNEKYWWTSHNGSNSRVQVRNTFSNHMWRCRKVHAIVWFNHSCTTQVHLCITINLCAKHLKSPKTRMHSRTLYLDFSIPFPTNLSIIYAENLGPFYSVFGDFFYHIYAQFYMRGYMFLISSNFNQSHIHCYPTSNITHTSTSIHNSNKHVP
jgi:hypothetical protein